MPRSARVRSLRSGPVELIFFKPEGWKAWGLEHEPVIPEQMPILIDSDLFRGRSRVAPAVGGGEPMAA